MQSSNFSFNPQDLKISPTKYLNQKLWRPSQTTLSFVSPRLSFSKQERFKLHSIYWPQKQINPIVRINKQRSQIDQIAKKISKQIDQQEKNQKRIKYQFISNKLKPKSKSFRKKQSLQEKHVFKLSDQNLKILQRLGTTLTKRQSSLRDRHGNRSNLFEDQQFPFLKTQFIKLNSSSGFRTSRRLNFNLPHNYYPGPGSYEIKRYLQNKQKKIKQ